MSDNKPKAIVYIAIREYRNLIGFVSPQDALDFIADCEAHPEYDRDGRRELIEYTIMSPEQVEFKGLTCLGAPTGPRLRPVT
jgi:hypothetical protein